MPECINHDNLYCEYLQLIVNLFYVIKLYSLSKIVTFSKTRILIFNNITSGCFWLSALFLFRLFLSYSDRFFLIQTVSFFITKQYVLAISKHSQYSSSRYSLSRIFRYFDQSCNMSFSFFFKKTIGRIKVGMRK